MAVHETTHETLLELLAHVHGKAEIVAGEIVPMSPTGAASHYAANEIFVSLYMYVKKTGQGMAISDNAGFSVDLPDRDSFSPDAGYYIGRWTGKRFFDGPPAFAAEVRSESDYGPKAEKAMARKRGEYFAAGALVVWDVDLDSSDVVRVYRADRPTEPVIYRRGDQAEAEPAVPGWSIPVDVLFFLAV